jgi:hypothetical protein
MENIPIFYFYQDDLQANGRISEQAIERECRSLPDGCSCSINSKLVSELKSLSDDANGPISVRVGNRDVFKIHFVQ